MLAWVHMSILIIMLSQGIILKKIIFQQKTSGLIKDMFTIQIIFQINVLFLVGLVPFLLRYVFVSL
jgi:hypothetical protein